MSPDAFTHRSPPAGKRASLSLRPLIETHSFHGTCPLTLTVSEEGVAGVERGAARKGRREDKPDPLRQWGHSAPDRAGAGGGARPAQGDRPRAAPDPLHFWGVQLRPARAVHCDGPPSRLPGAPSPSSLLSPAARPCYQLALLAHSVFLPHLCCGSTDVSLVGRPHHIQKQLLEWALGPSCAGLQ